MKFRLIFIFLLFNSLVFSQSVPLGQWEAHLPYIDAFKIEDAGNKIYCASTHGLFYYDKTDNHLQKITKVDGLSDIEIGTIKYNPTYKTLVVGFKNGNIDLISDNGIFNLNDIKRKNITGDKTINDIYFNGSNVYLSCGFGIVLLDIERKEISDTYLIGDFGQDLAINGVVIYNDTIYAATQDSLRKAPLNNAELANFSQWHSEKKVPAKICSKICVFNKKIVLNSSNATGSDTLFVFDGKTVTKLEPDTAKKVKEITTNGDKLFITYTSNGNKAIYQYNENLIREKVIDKYWYFQSPNQAFVDNEKNIWIADESNGLVQLHPNGKIDIKIPNGPFRSSVYGMAFSNETLWVMSGGKDIVGSPLYNSDGFYKHTNQTGWHNYNAYNVDRLDTLLDFLEVAIDPSDENHIYAASWGHGILEFKGDKAVNHFNEKNSTLKPLQFSDPSYYVVLVGGIALDSYNNLWATNKGAASPLSVKKADGTWKSFNLDFNIPISEFAYPSTLFIDSYNQKWIVQSRQGPGKIPRVVVFNDNNTIDDNTDDQVKALTFTLSTGSGDQISEVFCLAEDKDGAIWVGTDHGIAVIYSPGQVFNSDFAPQQIFIEQDGNGQYLLEAETVTSIVVDGANRKWVGTSRGGVFLFTSDGTKELLHFTAENSPLLSNNILRLALNPKTGEVFIGTDRGIISYKGSATEGGDEFKSVYAYPNPVPHNYEGQIGVKGLVANSNVKITDLEGKLVFETIANGGEAIWDGKTLNGERVQTGVYMVFCVSPDGQKTFMTKIMFIN